MLFLNFSSEIFAFPFFVIELSLHIITNKQQYVKNDLLLWQMNLRNSEPQKH